MMTEVLILLAVLLFFGLLLFLLLPYGRHARVGFEKEEEVWFEEEGVIVRERLENGVERRHAASRVALTDRRIIITRPLLRWKRPQFNLLLYFSEQGLPAEVRCLRGIFRIGLIDRNQGTLDLPSRTVHLHLAPPSAGCGPIPVRKIAGTIDLFIESNRPEELLRALHGERRG